MPMRFSTLRFALVAALAAAVLAPAAATAAPRMLVGFQDDPSFRWRPDRAAVLDRAQAAHARIVKTSVYWFAVAPKRPARATDSFDPAYNFADLDELVRNANSRGMDVLLSIWGTPAWANGNKGKNRLPNRLADLTSFARAVSSRYSGLHNGLPYVGRYAIWNESNLEQFLAPQYDAKGRDTGPKLYAKLYRAAYNGIKAGNRTALVAIGETSARGRDKALHGKTQETHSPGRFAELVAKADRKLRFDAWSHHPYPTSPNLAPTQTVRWPNVTLLQMPRFEQSLDKWFKRKNIPIWITEYGHETKPGERLGVTLPKQAAYAKQALGLAEKDARVQMFVWFVFRDDATSLWQSGLLGPTGSVKPALAAFTATAARLDAANPIVKIAAGPSTPLLRVPAFEFVTRSGPGQPVQVNYEFREGKYALQADLRTSTVLGRDGYIQFRIPVTAQKGMTYVVRLAAFDIYNNRIDREVTLVA